MATAYSAVSIQVSCDSHLLRWVYLGIDDASMKSTNRGGGSRPSPLNSSKSFTRYDVPAPAGTSRNRASTVSTGATPGIHGPRRTSTQVEGSQPHKDVFERASSEDTPDVKLSEAGMQSLPEGFDNLPIELASLADRWGLLCVIRRYFC